MSPLEVPSRIPPHNLDAERAVLGAILLEGREALPRVVEVLRPSDFYTEAHRTIYQAMLTLFDRGAPVDALTLSEELRRTDQIQFVGGPAAIALLIVGAAAYQPLKDAYDQRQFKDKNLDEIGAPATACQKVTTKKAEGNQNHVPTGQHVDYTTAPPAFGPHWNEPGVAPAPMERKLYTDDRPELESLVAANTKKLRAVAWAARSRPPPPTTTERSSSATTAAR